MNGRDPWVMLGVDRSASDQEIKRAYRKLSKKYHPDHNPGDAEAAARFQEISQAYNAIRNEPARARWLADNESPAATGLADDFPPYPGTGPAAGRQQAARRRSWNQEIETEVKVSFRQAFSGDQVDIVVEVEDLCEVCGGTGAAPGSTPRTCDLCAGTGEHKVGRVSTPCSACRNGIIVDRLCGHCDGGITKEPRPFVCQIPPGVPDGYKMRISGPQRGRFGSIQILVTVRVEPSPVFERNLTDPADLMIEVPITYSEAVLGAQIRIPTPAKMLGLEVPKTSSSGRILRIRNEGMPRLDQPGERGDLYAKLQIVVPEEPSRAQEKLIRQLAEHDPEEPRFPLFDKLSEG